MYKLLSEIITTFNTKNIIKRQSNNIATIITIMMFTTDNATFYWVKEWVYSMMQRYKEYKLGLFYALLPPMYAPLCMLSVLFEKELREFKIKVTP